MHTDDQIQPWATLNDWRNPTRELLNNQNKTYKIRERRSKKYSGPHPE